MTTTPGSDNARLPVTVVPKHYHVTYEQIDFANFTFTGTVSLQCTAAVTLEKTSLTLHALEVSLLSAVLEKKKSDDDDDDRTVLHAEEFRYQPKNQTVRISFGEDNFLKEGTDYVLEIEFRGILNDQMHGLYRSTYTGVDGKTHIMATTQFEATDARRAFPCFDEPALKATFQVTVTIPANKQVVSNTPIASSHTTGGGDDGTPLMKTITFQETPKMSTYLLALVVGEFDATSATSHGTVTTVYTVPGKADQGQFCLDVAVRCLDLYEKLFGIHYPLTKSDLLAIPDFAAGKLL
jgi:aminopeptidase N